MISAAIIYLGRLFPPLGAYMFDDRGRQADVVYNRRPLGEAVDGGYVFVT